MFKRIFSILTLVLFVVVVFAQNKSKDTTSNDVLYKKARELAYNGSRAKSREICYAILKKDNNLYDVAVLLGRTYAWDKQYDSARAVLKRVIVSKPGYYDAIDALIDVEFWNDKYNDALNYANTGLSFHKNDEAYLLKKAKALSYLNRNDEAVDVINQLLLLNTTNKDALNLLESIKESKRLNTIAANYSVDAFKHSSPWIYSYLQYSRRTKLLGSFITRLNYADRFSYSGFQLECDAYPTIRKGTYLYLNAGYANNQIYPLTRIGLEIYQKLPASFELSAGFRYLNFNNKLLSAFDSTKVMIYTASLGKYYGNYWFSLRTYITPGAKAVSKSFNLIARRYFSNADNYLSLTLGTGYSPDDHKYAFVEPTLYFLKSEKAYLEYQHKLSKRFMVNLGTGIAYEEFYPKLYRYRYSFSATIYYKF